VHTPQIDRDEILRALGQRIVHAAQLAVAIHLENQKKSAFCVPPGNDAQVFDDCPQSTYAINKMSNQHQNINRLAEKA
jgi:hypothetical protein